MQSTPTTPATTTPSTPTTTSLVDLPALVLSTHVLPRLPASSVGKFACSCRFARDAAHEDERLWKLLCARRMLSCWCPGAADVPSEAWKLPPRVRWASKERREPGLLDESDPRRRRGRAVVDDCDDADVFSDDEGFEPAGDPSPPSTAAAPPGTYRDLYSRLLGWEVGGGTLGPFNTTPDACLGGVWDVDRDDGTQDSRYLRETVSQTAARRPIGTALSFEPAPRGGSVVAYALAPTKDLEAGFVRTPILEIVPSRRAGRSPHVVCLRFAQAARDYLSRIAVAKAVAEEQARRERGGGGGGEGAIAAIERRAESARRLMSSIGRRTGSLRPRRHYEGHAGRVVAMQYARDEFDLECQRFLEEEASVEGRPDPFGGLSVGRGASGRAGGPRSLGSATMTPSNWARLPPYSFAFRPSGSTPSPLPPTRPALYLCPCEASCRQTQQDGICRHDAICRDVRRRSTQHRVGAGGAGEGGGDGGGGRRRGDGSGDGGGDGGGDETEEEDEGDSADLPPPPANVLPAWPGAGLAAPPLDRNGDGVRELPRLTERGNFLEMLAAMGSLGTEVCGGRGPGAWETLMLDPLDVPPPPGCSDVGPSTPRLRGRGGEEQGRRRPTPTSLASSRSSLCSPLQRELEGVWKGDYGPHGVEVVRVVFLDYRTRDEGEAAAAAAAAATTPQRPPPHFAAFKITGDANVPAGVPSFAVPASTEDCSGPAAYSRGGDEGAPFSLLDVVDDVGGAGTLGGGARARARGEGVSDDGEADEVNRAFQMLVAERLREGRGGGARRDEDADAAARGAAGGDAPGDLLRLSSLPDSGLGAPVSLPDRSWRCSHDLSTARPSPLRARGHWPAVALVARQGFRSAETIAAQVVSVSRDCLLVAWGNGMRKVSVFARVYPNEVGWAGPDGARAEETFAVGR